MLKREAIELLGGTPAAVAREIGVKPQAVAGWPEQLSRRVEDRVLAALYRRQQRAAAAVAASTQGR